MRNRSTRQTIEKLEIDKGKIEIDASGDRKSLCRIGCRAKDLMPMIFKETYQIDCDERFVFNHQHLEWHGSCPPFSCSFFIARKHPITKESTIYDNIC